MTARERRRLVCVALALLAAVALVIAGVLGSADRGTATDVRAARPSAPVVQSVRRADARRARSARVTPGQRAAREDLPVGVTPPPALQRRAGAARLAAAAFVRALLRLESTGARADEGALRAHATRLLARRILSGHARLPLLRAAPAAGRLIALEPLASGPDRAEFVATVARNGGRTGLPITVVRRRGRWLVGGLG